MLSRVEDALNGIWGVRFGRSWRDRFSNYLLFLVVFFLVGATTLTMLSAASLAASFGAGATWLTGWLQKIPGGGWLTDFVSGGGPLFVSLALLTLAFAAFNRQRPFGQGGRWCMRPVLCCRARMRIRSRSSWPSMVMTGLSRRR